MAQAMNDKSETDLNFLTDCKYFLNSRCKLDENCGFRHCSQAVQQLQNCERWPKKCRNVACPYRHPIIKPKIDKKKPLVAAAAALVNHPVQPPPPVMKQQGFISFFWDIENVPIPRGQKPFDIVQRIRQKLVTERGLQEVDFSCYCNSNTIPQENLQKLHQSTVRIVHVPDRKPGAVDRQIMLDLDRFERVHRPPATVVLISGDIDFVGKLSNLRHHAGFHVIVIHNKSAKEELKATVNEHYPWELFTQPMESVNTANGWNPIDNERDARPFGPNRARHHSTGPAARRSDPSPCRRIPANRQQQPPPPLIVNNLEGIKHACPICNNQFDSIQALRQHQAAKDHLFSCPVCKEKFVTIEGQAQHQKGKNHYTRDYKCDQCNRSFTKIESLTQHQQATGHMQSPSDSSNTRNPDQNNMDIILKGIEAIKKVYIK